MSLLDPTTGSELPADAIQRILFIANTAHVYNIPPRPTTKGHIAASWTGEPARHIFTARIRVLETATDDILKVDVILEDPKTGALFAAAPYEKDDTVEPVLDSSRFFAVTVRDPQGRKAILGVGFEERETAFDFGVALQEARRGLGWEAAQSQRPSVKEDDKDYSLKEGQTITVNIGNTGIGRRRAASNNTTANSSAPLQSFALAPPPGGGVFGLPPPPSASDERRRKRQSAQDLGFDDGQFGEFA